MHYLYLDVQMIVLFKNNNKIRLCTIRQLELQDILRIIIILLHLSVKALYFIELIQFTFEISHLKTVHVYSLALLKMASIFSAMLEADIIHFMLVFLDKQARFGALSKLEHQVTISTLE